MSENEIYLGDLVYIGDKSAYVSGVIEDSEVKTYLLNESDYIIEINDNFITLYYPSLGLSNNLSHCREIASGEFSYLATNMFLYNKNLPIIKFRKLKSNLTARSFFILYRGPEIITFVHNATIPKSYLDIKSMKRGNNNKSVIYISSEVISQIPIKMNEK